MVRRLVEYIRVMKDKTIIIVLKGYGDNYCPYWLRDGIVKGDDGKNYVTCVTSCPPFDQTTKYLANKTFVGIVPAIIIEL